mmetsp:Transcript_9991/g.13188  ORF Transcript_9991/g.13188 Transcript_9991/m.13188 type:complete len:280 (+) Transcript_9991:163-1002(+)
MPIAGNIGGVGDAQGPDSWFKALPIITRYWFGASLVITLAVNFQIISTYSVIYDWQSVQNKFEVWRFLSCFLYIGKFEFNTLISLMLLVQFSQRYEQGGPFNTGAGGGTADYCFMIMVMMVFTLLSYPLTLMIAPIPPIFAKNMVYGVLYIWSKRNPTSQASIWGISVPSIYLPFAYIAMTVFMGGNPMDMLHGMAVGHLYYFLADVVPQVQGKDILVTPQFLIDYFGVGQFQAPVAPAAPASGTATPGVQRMGRAAESAASSSGGHSWGTSGNRLGRE